MGILKLKPCCKDYIWGGRRLAEEYGIQSDKDVLAEAWVLSCHPDGPSVIVNGPHAGKTLAQYIQERGTGALGAHCRRFRDFPILVKFIDAKQNLSVQVHPGNRYALAEEHQYGKTEMWYVMDAGPNAFLYYGFKREVSREEFARRIREDTLLEVLNAVPVQKGDVLFIEAGTIHAIGANILVAEIQQNSNVTYRVYDYGRVGKDGKKRDLHIEKALAVTNRVPILRSGRSYPHVADCDYFTVDKLNLDGRVMRKVEGAVGEESFVSILMMNGSGKIVCDGESVPYRKGDSFFLPAGSGAYTVEGSCDALITSIRGKTNLVRAGIDIGGRFTKVGLVDEEQRFLAYRELPFDPAAAPEQSVRDAGNMVMTLLEEHHIDLDLCANAGVGVAGIVEDGVVRYSNNIGWKEVPVASILGELLPIPIHVANNADCAVLGEMAAGAAQECEDVLLLTIGWGVGSGLVHCGQLYDGAEFGHMVIEEDGRPCSCGRCGCLEAYVSVTALRKETAEVLGTAMEWEELWKAAGEGSAKARELADAYIRRLSTGVVNLVNILHPRMVVIGGNLAAYGETWLEPLKESVQSKSFGGRHSSMPEIKAGILGRKAGTLGAANLV